DRVTHLYEQDRGPLTPKAFSWTADAGVQYAFDNNIFLTQNNKTSDSIIIPFVQAGFSYAEPRFDVEASLLANYKFYVKENPDDDEERVFLRARQTSSRWNFEVSELFQNVSDPSGVVFFNRVSRIVSTTVPKAAFDLGRNWAFEVGGNLQFVRFQDQPYSQGQENNNFQVDAALVYHTPWAFDAVAQFSYYNINYLTDPTETFGTPDAFGYMYRVGFRGDVIQRLTLEALVGYASIETDFFASGGDLKDNTVVLNVNLRYEATDKVNFFFDFARMYTFNGFGDPYQLLNTAAIVAQIELTEQFTLRGRLQYDHSETALNVTRNYLNASAGGAYRFGAHWIFDAGLSYRWGKTENVGQLKFSDIVFSIGLAFTW
ncbi:MAG: hypothetical protein JO332_14190, partial [Planctomycetaceae bacterium]|nr:hypothetical protein [Planctomycetaceae bacterium]